MSTSRRLRLAAGAGAAAIAAASLTIVSAGSAQAATSNVDDVSLSWGVSVTANSWGIATAGAVAPISPTTGTTIDGASTSYNKASGITLSDGSGDLIADGTGEVDFTGSVTYSPFDQYGTMVADKATLTMADFELEITEPGEGELTAKVSYHKISGDLAATRVTVATFDITSQTIDEDGVLALQTAAPDWTGTVETGKYAATYSDAWPTSLVDTLLTNVDSGSDLSVYFYRTGNTAGNNNKAPLAMSATGTVTDRVVSATPSYFGLTATVAVAGTGFTGTDGNPGDDGVYVGLAPAGGLPDVSTPEGMGSFAAAEWVSAAALADREFSVELEARAADLEADTAYAVYTWRAHGHSSTSQDTETPVDIDVTQLAAIESSVTTGGPASTTYGKTAVVTATVPDEGTVTLTGLGASKKVILDEAGTASFAVPASLSAGSYTATFAYSGGGDYAAGTATKKFSVAKATTTTSVAVTPKPTAKKAGKATVTLKGAPAGKVVVKVKGAGKTVTKTVKVNAQGKAVVALAKAPKGGAFTITVTYAGDANRKASSDKATYSVAKPKPRKK